MLAEGKKRLQGAGLPINEKMLCITKLNSIILAIISAQMKFCLMAAR